VKARPPAAAAPTANPLIPGIPGSLRNATRIQALISKVLPFLFLSLSDSRSTPTCRDVCPALSVKAPICQNSQLLSPTLPTFVTLDFYRAHDCPSDYVHLTVQNQLVLIISFNLSCAILSINYHLDQSNLLTCSLLFCVSPWNQIVYGPNSSLPFVTICLHCFRGFFVNYLLMPIKIFNSLIMNVI
jgi:hypothetical protein